MTFKALLLDCDGVVLREHERFSTKLKQENGIPDEDIDPFFTDTFLPYCLTGEKDVQEEVGPWLERWNWDGTAKELLRYWFESGSDVDETMISIIKALRTDGAQVYLLTNQDPRRTAYLREELGFSTLFDDIFSSGEIGVKKPDPAFYGHVIDVLAERGIQPEETFYIDDEAQNVSAAKQMGIEGIVFEREADVDVLQGLLQRTRM